MFFHHLFYCCRVRLFSSAGCDAFLYARPRATSTRDEQLVCFPILATLVRSVLFFKLFSFYFGGAVGSFAALDVLSRPPGPCCLVNCFFYLFYSVVVIGLIFKFFLLFVLDTC